MNGKHDVRDCAYRAVRDAWRELGEYWATDRAGNATMPLYIDDSLDPYIVMHDTLEHGRLELGLVLRSADVERLARVGADAWTRAIGRDA